MNTDTAREIEKPKKASDRNYIETCFWPNGSDSKITLYNTVF